MTPILGAYMLSAFTQKATKVDELLRWQTQLPGCGVNNDAQEGHINGRAFALMSSEWYVQVMEDIAHSVLSQPPF